jgi:hypothetical protein
MSWKQSISLLYQFGGEQCFYYKEKKYEKSLWEIIITITAFNLAGKLVTDEYC